MQKLTTLFKKDPTNLALVINEINPGNEWVYEKEVKATRKFDGMACAVINGELYKRRDVKKDKQVPEGAIPCCEPDEITGHWPHWMKCDRNNPDDKHFWEGFDNTFNSQPDYKRFNGTYELCGPRISTNRGAPIFNVEGFERHVLVKHGAEDLFFCTWLKKPDGDYIYNFEHLKEILSKESIEGIVFHHPDGRMCKIRKSDFGIKR